MAAALIFRLKGAEHEAVPVKARGFDIGDIVTADAGGAFRLDDIPEGHYL